MKRVVIAQTVKKCTKSGDKSFTELLHGAQALKRCRLLRSIISRRSLVPFGVCALHSHLCTSESQLSIAVCMLQAKHTRIVWPAEQAK